MLELQMKDRRLLENRKENRYEGRPCPKNLADGNGEEKIVDMKNMDEKRDRFEWGKRLVSIRIKLELAQEIRQCHLFL